MYHRPWIAVLYPVEGFRRETGRFFQRNEAEAYCRSLQKLSGLRGEVVFDPPAPGVSDERQA